MRHRSSTRATGCIIPDVSFEADEWVVTRHCLNFNFARSGAASDGCAYAPEHKKGRGRAGAGRGSGSLVGQPSAFVTALCLRCRSISIYYLVKAIAVHEAHFPRNFLISTEVPFPWKGLFPWTVRRKSERFPSETSFPRKSTAESLHCRYPNA